MSDTLREALETAVAAVDTADKECPIQRSSRHVDKCPKCGAGSSDGCGPEVSAAVQVVDAARALLAASPAVKGDWVLVPREPAREQQLRMQRALLDNYPTLFEDEVYTNANLLDAIYAAAISAAPPRPTPPAQAQDSDPYPEPPLTSAHPSSGEWSTAIGCWLPREQRQRAAGLWAALEECKRQLAEERAASALLLDKLAAPTPPAGSAEVVARELARCWLERMAHRLDPEDARRKLENIWRSFDPDAAAVLAALSQPDDVWKSRHEAFCGLLASIWFYGGFKAETPRERQLEGAMVAAAWWPTDEATLLDRLNRKGASLPTSTGGA